MTATYRYRVEVALYDEEGDFTGEGEVIYETDDRDEAIDTADRTKLDNPNGQVQVREGDEDQFVYEPE